jgi:hypothetical protein
MAPLPGHFVTYESAVRKTNFIQISHTFAKTKDFVTVLNYVSYASEMLMFVLQSVSVHIMFDKPQIKENRRIFQSLVPIPLKTSNVHFPLKVRWQKE